MKKIVCFLSLLFLICLTLNVTGQTSNVEASAANHQFTIEDISYEAGRIRIIKAKCSHCSSGYFGSVPCSYCTPGEVNGFNGVFIEIKLEYDYDASYCDATAYINSSRSAECFLYDSGAWGLQTFYPHEQHSYRFYRNPSENYMLRLWVSGLGYYEQSFNFIW